MRPDLRILTCMKAVAMMTPDPKYLAIKKAHCGTLSPRFFCAKTGKTAPGYSQQSICLTWLEIQRVLPT